MSRRVELTLNETLVLSYVDARCPCGVPVDEHSTILGCRENLLIP
jgi:hypothetical protein